MILSGRVPDPGARRLAVAAVALGFFWIPAAARSAPDEAVRRLNLAEALAAAESRGFDALLAEAAVSAAAADAEAARRLPNPDVSGAYLHSTMVPVAGGEASSSGFSVSLSEQGAIEGTLSGKRSLRVQAAAAALEAARSNREDGLRVIRREVTRAFYDVLLAEAAENIRRGVAESYARTSALVALREEYGAASRADRVRLETARLEADQAVSAAAADSARARAALGVWLGGEDLDGVRLDGDLAGDLPAWVSAGEPGLAAEAVGTRADVRSARRELERADAAYDLARRERIPDVALAVGYARQGPESNPVTPPTLSFGAAFELPVFSQRQGEIARAESERSAARIAVRRAEARVSADVRAAWATLNAAREQADRMETQLFGRAIEARDLVRDQYREGAVSLLDLFDAERTALAVELERAQDLYGVRVAVAELAAAVGRSDRP